MNTKCHEEGAGLTECQSASNFVKCVLRDGRRENADVGSNSECGSNV
jgi:hypothetical protein